MDIAREFARVSRGDIPTTLRRRGATMRSAHDRSWNAAFDATDSGACRQQ
jgi:hypothetical protein